MIQETVRGRRQHYISQVLKTAAVPLERAADLCSRDYPEIYHDCDTYKLLQYNQLVIKYSLNTKKNVLESRYSAYIPNVGIIQNEMAQVSEHKQSKF